MLKAYFDGSVEISRAMTLACLAGYDGVWTEIEAKWEDVREKRGNPPYIHMTDLMALEGIYKGWETEKRDFLVGGLLNVLLDFRSDKRLQSFTCSVDLVSYERWKDVKNHPSPGRLCARVVLPEAIKWYSQCEAPILDAVLSSPSPANSASRSSGIILYIPFGIW